MPEIKNSFQKGVMNKDLDERLVPNGQYRDAMNVQVSTSEGSEVGTVQNILGNIREDGLIDLDSGDFTCVGAVSDEKNDVLYWFVTSTRIDAIIEYHNNGTATPILVDRTRNVLKFDSQNTVTGINIIDSLLFWTDDVNEPRKINIDTLKLNLHTDLSTHSNMYVSGSSVGPITEDHITVIRKRPQKAPTVVFPETSLQTIYQGYNAGTGGSSYGFDLNGVEVGSTDVSLNRDFILSSLDTTSPFVTGDTLLLLQNSAIGNLPKTYELKMKVTGPPVAVIIFTITIGWVIPFEVMEIEGAYNSQAYELNVIKEVDVDPIFERELVRFATRYKYTDGEYSAFSPFTQPIFFAGAFGFHPTKDPYNLGMENNAISIRLQDLIPTDTPDDVVQLDILFKKERSTTIYSVDSIKQNDPNPNYWNKKTYNTKTILNSNYPVIGSLDSQYHNPVPYEYEYKGEYEITVENIYAALPSNQMLRPWDNVPRKALAQEVTANRVVYANYLQNYDLKDDQGDITKPLITTTFENRDILGVEPTFPNARGKQSVKSLRTYYLGIVYGDEYGRETPVFTSKDASINVPFDQDSTSLFNGTADKSLRLTAALSGNQPEWAHYFKYYIKQTTGEYYNLTLDRVYKTTGDSNLWISFPSSDRNKVQEGDYFSIKKQVDVEEIIPVENKIKIIDIKNEAPETIKYEYISLGTAGGSASDLSALFPDISASPGAGVKRLLLDKNAWEDESGLALEDLSKSDRLAIQFTITENSTVMSSEKYFISGYSLRDNGGDTQYNLVLRKGIESQDDWVESAPGVLNSDDNLNITIYRLEQKDAIEFEGRFFVKIISNPVTQTYLVPSTSDTLNFATLAKMKFYNLVDAAGVPGVSAGIYNTTSISPQNTSLSFSSSSSPSDWDFQIDNMGGPGFFIDSMPFVAGQDIDNFNVANSGKIYKGNPTDIAQYVNGFEGIISPPLSNNGEDILSGPYTTQGGGNALSARHISTKAMKLLPNEFVFGNTTALPNPNVEYLSSFDDARAYKPLPGGGHFIHLSFMAPGVDLHSGSVQELRNAHANAQNWPYTSSSNSGNHIRDIFKTSLENIRATSIYIDGAESEINDTWENKVVGSNGYNVTQWSDQDLEDHQNQWNPGYLNPGAQSVINQLNTGSKFKIAGDDLDNTYTIKGVTPVRIYNHTSWNPSPHWYLHPNGSDNFQTWDGDRSVAKHIQRLFNQLTYGGYGLSPYLDSLEVTLGDFGSRNNRRICYIIQVDQDPTTSSAFNGTNFLNNIPADNDEHQIIRFVDNYIEPGANTMPISPAIFETEAKEDVDLNIYYEASDALPVELDTNTDSLKGHLLGPVGSKVTCGLTGSNPAASIASITDPSADFFPRVVGWEGNVVEINNPGFIDFLQTGTNNNGYIGAELTFWREDSGYTTAKITAEAGITGLYITKFQLQTDSYDKKVGLSYYNCFSFGNGVESNRIRDDFNESFILNGVKASTVLEEPYEEERRKYGLIYSGVYNSISGVNNLNQFIQAEKITKDLMPSYGSIQKLYARDKDLITLCEDKVIRIYVDKDILYNADGNTQLLATNRVLGTAEPFRGNFGISKNPESFAAESFRAYFTDKQRGAVIRLSMDGLTPISDAGMHDYFRDNLINTNKLFGSYDSYKENYNLTISTLVDTGGVVGGTAPSGGGGTSTGGGGTILTRSAGPQSSESYTSGPRPPRGGGGGGVSVGIGVSTNTVVLTNAVTVVSAGPQIPGCMDPLANNYNPLATTDDRSCMYSPPGPPPPPRVTLKTLSFNEKAKGWTSFKSFTPEFGISSVNQYYTMDLGMLWKHHTNETRNTFYDVFIESSVTPILNMQPALVKNFNTLNYEGTQSRVDQYISSTGGNTDEDGNPVSDGQYYNLELKKGWYIEDIHTDKQEGTLNEFIEKEGKWFNYIKGKTGEINTAAFNFQGLGIAEVIDII